MTSRSRGLLRPRRACLPAALILLLLLGGCGGLAGPGRELLSIPAAQYDEAFDAALSAAGAEGLPPVLRDRRAGIIETDPEIAGSLLEPFRSDNASLGQAWENTASMQRRRARFEFVPAGYRPPAGTETGPLTGPDLLLEERPLTDLTEGQTDVELRVWVYVERAYEPGVRRNTWSRRLTTKSDVFLPDDPEQTWPGIFWTPVSRDPDTEQRLLHAIAQRLERAGR